MYFVNFFIQGVANGYLPLASFTYGAKDYQRLWDAIVWNLKVLTGYSLIAIGLVALFAPAFVSVFTTGQAAQSYGAQYLKAYNWSLPVYSIYYIFTITLQAARKGAGVNDSVVVPPGNHLCSAAASAFQDAGADRCFLRAARRRLDYGADSGNFVAIVDL